MTALIGIVQRMNRRLLSRMDGHTAEVLSGASLAFVLRAVGAGLAFALNVVIARLLGAEGAGLYFLALSVVMITAVVAKLGLDNTLLRFIAAGAAKNDWGQVKGVFRLGMRLGGSASLGLSLTVLFAAPWLASNLFNEPELTGPLRWMSFGIAGFATMTLLAESLKGLKRIRDSMLVSGVLYPMVALALIWPLVTLMGPAGAVLGYVLGTGAAAFIGWLFWQRAIAPQTAPAAPFDRTTLWASSRPLWTMSIINRAVLPWVPLVLLGFWGTAEDVGIFGAATRVAMLVTFFLTAVNTVIAPKFAELHAKDEIQAIGRLARRFTLLITLAASPFFLLLIFAGDWVMAMFGSEFTRGGTALAILAVGQAVNTMTGSVGYLLMMSGHQRDVRNSALFATVVMSVTAGIVMPLDPMVGAAAANASAIAGMNLYSALIAKSKLKLSILFSRKLGV